MNPIVKFVILYLLGIGLISEYAFSVLPEKKTKINIDTLAITIEEIDTLQSWTSPLFGHHAAKMGISRDGSRLVAKFSGSYPKGQVDIMEAKNDGGWKLKANFTGVYQPSLLLVDESDHINIIQNSQTEPIVHFRSTGTAQISTFDTIAKGNGLSDGRGWYIGAAVSGEKIYMAYVTLSYNLFLTWKNIGDSIWNTPIVIHPGSIDPIKGNHSWLRPKFDFYGDYGYFVVNETSDGSVKNTYNAVVLVKFSLSDPQHFKTEYIDKVPTGYTAFSTDFSISPSGQIACIYQIGKKIYDSGKNEKQPIEGLYIGLRYTNEGKWESVRLFEDSREGAIIFGEDNSLCVLQMYSRGYDEKIDSHQVGAISIWKAKISHDGGEKWNDVAIKEPNNKLVNPTHLELAKSKRNSFGQVIGLFDDLIYSDRANNLRFFRLYALHIELKPHPGNH
jgi:hypothetical protein